MPVPTVIGDLSTTAIANSPQGTDSAKGTIDDYFRAHASFIAQNRDAIAAKVDASTFTAQLLLQNERTTVVIPKAGNLYSYGDSQTFGVNNGTGGLPYTDGARLLPAYRWVNQVATRNDRALTINDGSIGSSRISWVPGADATYPLIGSHFNCLGRLPFDWAGVVVAMPGWNNIDPANDGSAPFYLAMRRAHEAMIAKMMLTDWFGITHLGWNRALGSAGATYQWLTNTVVGDLGPQILNAGSNTNPFYFGDPSGSRYTIDLTAGKYVQFGVYDSRAVGLFFDTSPSATTCTFRVTVNDVVVGLFDTNYLAPAPFAADCFPCCVFLDEMPAGSTVKVECTAGVVRWIAGGTVPRDTASAPIRSVLYGTTTGNTANGRTKSHLHACAKQTEAAVAAFSSRYPVYLVNNMSNWLDATDQEPTDISHLTDTGNEKVHQNFVHAAKPNGSSSPNYINMADFMSRSLSQDSSIDVQKDWTISSVMARFRDLSGNVLGVFARVNETGVQSNDLHIRAFDRILFSPANAWSWAMAISSSTVRLNKPLVLGSGVAAGNYTAKAAEYSNARSFDFASIAASGFEDQTITVTGAAVGDTVLLAAIDAMVEVGIDFQGRVTAANTVTVRAKNSTSGAINPAAVTIRVMVIAQTNS